MIGKSYHSGKRILNKNGALNPAEREIMEQHALLSYELLKTTDLDKQTLDLIKNQSITQNKMGSNLMPTSTCKSFQ